MNSKKLCFWLDSFDDLLNLTGPIKITINDREYVVEEIEELTQDIGSGPQTVGYKAILSEGKD